MNSNQFRYHGKKLVDWMCNYMNTIEDREVGYNVQPFYLKKLIPNHAPTDGECFENVMADFEKKIMPGVLHWKHPHFHAYFPSGNSYPSIMGDMLSSTIASCGFSWASCPASTELEMIVMDWYARALDLPKQFISDLPNAKGGGILQGSASECIFTAMMAAREKTLRTLTNNDEKVLKSTFLPKLVAYTSKEAHSCVQKAAIMSLVQIRLLDVDEVGRLQGSTLQTAIAKDVAAGLTPFMVVGTYGTTGMTAFDNLEEISKVCKQYPSVWFHVDGAYGGNSWIVPELRKFRKGFECADSFNTNPNKSLCTAFDASALWVRDMSWLEQAFTINPVYLKHANESQIVDHRHYGIPLSRRFRSLKLWFLFRTYGITGLQEYMNQHVKMAQVFHKFVQKDNRFEVVNEVNLGLVCLRLKNSNDANHKLLDLLHQRNKIHVIPSMTNDKFYIRFCVNYDYPTEKHMEISWKEIQLCADEVLCGMHKVANSNSNAPTSSPYIKVVPRDVYDEYMQNPSLRDDSLPLIVPEPENNAFDTLKAGRRKAPTS